ncbi:Cyclin-D-binding Myb-like transcription factor 1 [Camelus dromedarius]|uniref:Cyclin-D-binding Myb-like transcription factor 1 n=1 Tax=Camelus dromedarius TaxID=9838 RepID=A0A5N4E0K5_CAMDR|nr:Cyclin-D-binding Myb-like transcription factor 1 [Camelus dromedarius]
MLVKKKNELEELRVLFCLIEDVWENDDRIARGIKDATEIIFEMSKDERKDFYRTIAWGLNRPLFAVYRRVLRMYDDRNHVGKYTPEEIEKLKDMIDHIKNLPDPYMHKVAMPINLVFFYSCFRLRIKHGNDWATIGAALGRSASSVKDRCRLMKDTCNTGKWTEEEEKRLAEVVHELTSTEPGDIVTQGVSWAAVAERVGTRSEKQCRSKWLNYLNWKQSGGTEWTKEDEINLILSGFSSHVKCQIEGVETEVLSPYPQNRQRQCSFSTAHQCASVLAERDHVKDPKTALRIAELDVADENDINWDLLAEGWSSVRSPQWLRSKWWTIKRQIANHKDVSFPASADSPAATVDSETITLNSGTLQTFEILPSFHLQPTGTPGTYLLQTSSSQGLPLTLTASPTVTLTAAAPASPEQIIVHALSPEHLLNTSDNVTVQCHTPRVIIQTVATEDITSSISQAELTVDSDIHSSDFPEPPDALEADTFPDEIHQPKITIEPSFNDAHVSKFSDQNSTELMNSVMVRTEEEISDTDLKQEDTPSPLARAYVTETSDVIDTESVLPLTTLTDPILQHHREESNIIGSSLGSPVSEDSKDVEDLVNCH